MLVSSRSTVTFAAKKKKQTKKPTKEQNWDILRGSIVSYLVHVNTAVVLPPVTVALSHTNMSQSRKRTLFYAKVGK